MKIREAKEEDLEEITKLEQEVLYPELSVNELIFWIEGEDSFEAKIFVAEKDRIIIALAAYEIYEANGPEEIVLTLDGLVVDEKYQRQGIGRNLLLTSLKKAIRFYQRKNRFKVVGLLIQTDSDAAGFYEKVFPSEKIQRKTFFNVWKSKEPMIIFLVSV